MAGRYQETFEDRLARLKRRNRLCAANSEHCPRTAVTEYDLYPADGQGKRKPDAVLVTKKSCSYHRAQFARSGLWEVVDTRDLPLLSTSRS